MKYLEAHPLAGVGFRVVRWQRAPVGVGQLTMQAVKDRLVLDMQSKKTRSAEKVKELGEKIIEQELAAASGAVVTPAKEDAETAVKSS